ncbi:MAG: protein adenylyltransferase SelO, partial [Planktothrix sp.]
REVLAAEMLHRMRVKTSRCLSLIETGEQLWRGDEPSPTRSSVMIRFSSSHIRFGTFERLHYFKRKDLIEILLDHVITYYYSNLKLESDRYILFYTELVKRVAELVAQWMASGFCHGVLNTDNMSITGESFDYGPYAFMPDYNLQFTAAYFDYGKLYCYGNQPFICEGNLELLQKPLSLVIPLEELKKALDPFQQYYRELYRQRMINRLGFEQLPTPEAEELLQITINLLKNNRISYPDFFMQLREQFCQQWQDQPQNILKDAEPMEHLDAWRQQYYHHLQTLSYPELEQIKQRLNYYNPQVMIIRPEIEAVWEQITLEDNWQPFYNLLAQIKTE